MNTNRIERFIIQLWTLSGIQLMRLLPIPILPANEIMWRVLSWNKAVRLIGPKGVGSQEELEVCKRCDL